MDAIIKKEKIIEAVTKLTQNYNKLDGKIIARAITLLREATPVIRSVEAIRSDKIILIPREKDFIPFGEPWLDVWLDGGVRRKEILLFGGVPFSGKSHLLAWAGSRFIRRSLPTIAIYGEDMTADYLRYYELAVKNKMMMKNLWLADMDGKFNIEDIETVISQVRKQVEPIVLIVDHLKLMKLPYGFTGVDGLEALAVELKMLAKRENVILLTATQAGYGNDRHGLERLYGSKTGIAGNMDIAIMMEAYENQYKLSLEKAKGRKPHGDKEKIITVNWDIMEIYE